jgi:uncharacterized membrane protein HdeD (DUF308 family)
LLWGIWALLEGAGALVQAFQPESPGHRIWLVLMGLVALVAAFFAIFSPAVTAVALTWILGIWLIVRGAFEVLGAFSSDRQTPRWLLLASAALSLLLGLLFVLNPGGSAVGLAVWLGITAIVWGVVFLVMGLAVRRELGAGGRPARGDAPVVQ